MSFRFRKSINLGGGTRLNLSKSGLGISTGIRGFRVGVGPRGTYRSASIPGTGLGFTSYSGLGSKTSTSYTTASSHSLFILIFIVALLFSIFISPLAFIIVLLGGILIFYSPKARSQRLARKACSVQNQPELALKYAKQAYELCPTGETQCYLYSAALNNNSQFEEAIPILEKILSSNQNNTNVKVILGNCFYRLDRWAESIPLFQDVLLEDRDNLKVRCLLAGAFSGIDDHKSALEVLKAGPISKRKLDEPLMEFFYLLGEVLEDTGDHKTAKKYFEKVYANDASYLSVAQKLGK